MERSELQRDGELRGDHERGGRGDGNFQHGRDFHADGDRGGQRNRDRDEQSGGDQLPDDMLGELCERIDGDADGDGGRELRVCRMERSRLQRNGNLRGDDERGGRGDGDVQRDRLHADCFRGRERNGHGDE